MASAEQMLGMSLDDIIKVASKKKPAAKKDAKGKGALPAGGRGGKAGRGGAMAGRGGSNAGRGQGKPFGGQQRNSSLSVSRGGISKPRGSLSNRPIRDNAPIVRTIPGAAATRKPARPAPAPRQAPIAAQQPRQQQQQQQYRAATHLPSSGQMWQRDMYRDDDRPVRRTAAAPARPAGYKLKVRNLDHEVTEDDIKELFGSIGDLVSHKIRFDRSGRSMGTGEVVYSRKADAEAALAQYNGVQLDGKPMQISFDNDIMTLGSGISVTRPGGGNGGGRGMRTRDADDMMME